jgi:hypothetical protein
MLSGSAKNHIRGTGLPCSVAYRHSTHTLTFSQLRKHEILPKGRLKRGRPTIEKSQEEEVPE